MQQRNCGARFAVWWFLADISPPVPLLRAQHDERQNHEHEAWHVAGGGHSVAHVGLPLVDFLHAHGPQPVQELPVRMAHKDPVEQRQLEDTGNGQEGL